MDPVNNLLPFDYVVTSTAIAGSGTNTQSKIIEPNANFILVAILASSSLDAATDWLPNNFSFQIQYISSGRFLSDSNVLQRFASPINGGYKLLQPVRFDANGQFSIVFTNLSASTNTCTLNLRGFKQLLAA